MKVTELIEKLEQMPNVHVGTKIGDELYVNMLSDVELMAFKIDNETHHAVVLISEPSDSYVKVKKN